MKIRIYQTNPMRNTKRFATESLERFAHGLSTAKIDARLYDLTFEGDVDFSKPEEILRRFGAIDPESYIGRPLSSTDIVETTDEAGSIVFFYRDGDSITTHELAPPGTAANLKDNAYFANMKTVGEAWEKARAERKQRKEEIIQTYGWESAELQQWYAEDKAAAFPFTDGQSKAYRAWANSIYHGSSELECADLPWEKDTADFVATLREAGFTTLVVTDQSTALMESLHQLATLGCTLTGLCQITRRETRWGEEEPITVNGIRFGLN